MFDVTVGIKALNEEKYIAAAINSAITAMAPFRGEIILADSGSADATIAIAEQYDAVRIFKLANPLERSCGVGAQLAFQHAQGDYFCILDGDMELDSNFLIAGIRFLEDNREFAGVGGMVRQVNLHGEEYQIRHSIAEQESNWRPGVVDRLDCGGLYRADAIRQLGYFADRNLHSFEEFELGARLRGAGWKLARLDIPSVQHYGHTTGGYRLLLKRTLSGYVDGAGEVFRSAIAEPYLFDVLKRLRHIIYGIITILWWLALIYISTLHLYYGAATIIASLLIICLRRRSFSLGLYSFVMWNVSAIGLVRGFFRARKSPSVKIASVEHQRQYSSPAVAEQGER